ncbi:leucine-rich repeat domain-containing protein [Aeromicrobium endophyticum]|uniref:leucine-rich repeat domain-containing protein n=1 Tax=Aeromicrobium endophyticum TaxID=2292704 RepID=UPI001314569C|nr:leucine-rich repeat domain-containing protein [Aeromicrobium endophyticum]
MKTHSRLLGLPVAALIAGTLAVAAPAQAADPGTVSKDGLVYTLQPDGTASVAQERFVGGAVLIPPTVSIDGAERDVTTIADGGFKGRYVPRLHLGQKVTTIGDEAFADAQLGDVILPASVTTIGADAFDGNPGLTTATFLGAPPAIVPAGDDGSFGPGRDDLTLRFPAGLDEDVATPGYTKPTWKGYRSAHSPASVTTADGITYAENAAGDATAVSYTGAGGTIAIPSTVTIDDAARDVTTIADGVFEQQKLTGLSLGDHIESVGAYAFSENDLGPVVLPESVETIGEGAFFASRITALTLGGRISTIGRIAFSTNDFPSLSLRGSAAGTTVGDSAFQESRISQLTLGRGITSIGDYAFYNNYVPDIVVPAGVTSIGANAFNQNFSRSLVLGEGLVIIGSGAFGENQITDVTIPASVREIGGGAFSEALRSATLLGPPPQVEAGDSPSYDFSFGPGSGPVVLSVPAAFAASTTRPDGYTVPVWQGYSTVFFGPSAAAPAPAPTATPTASITGTAREGRTLTAGTGLPAGTAATFRWKADGRTIKGATGPALKLGKKQAARRVTVTVTAAGKVSASGATAVVTSKRARLVVSPTRIGRRDAFRVTAVGLRKDQKIRVWLGGRRVVIGKADRRGVVDRTVRFTKATDAGKRRVRVSGYSAKDKRTYTVTRTVRYLSR